MQPITFQPSNSAKKFSACDNAQINIGDKNYYYNSSPGSTHQAILNWFSPLNFLARQNDIFNKIQDGTGEWFLQSWQFCQWAEGTEKSLWCYGIPGAGKTFISSIVFNHLKKRFPSESVGIGCIFCDYNEEKDQTAEHLISSLIKQFVQCRKDFPDKISDEMFKIYREHQNKQTKPSLDVRLDLLRSEVSSFSKLFIIVDALDECTERDKTRGKVIQGIQSLLSGNVHLMVTSRNLDQIKNICDGWPQMEIKAIDQDIRNYLDAHMDDEGDLGEIIKDDPQIKEQIILKIQEMSQGMFLLARLQLTTLFYKDNPEDVLLALSSLPKGLSDTYDAMWDRIEKNQSTQRTERAKKVLSWISFTLRPLKIEEIQDALAVSLGDKTLNPNRRPVLSAITAGCMGLVVIEQESQVIRFVHETTQAHFKDKRHMYFPGAQQMIAETCLTYLSFDAFEKWYNTNQYEKEVVTRMHLFDYAAENWGFHASGDVEQAIQELILNFLKKKEKVSRSAQLTLVRCRLRSCTGMHISAYFGLRSSLTSLLKNGFEPDSEDDVGETPLSWSASSGHEEVVRLLLENGARIEAENWRGETPLSIAASRGHEAVVRILLENGAQIEAENLDGETPLFLAASRGHEAVVRLLRENGAQIEATNENGETPLPLAASRGHEAVVRLLLENGAQIEAKNWSGETPLPLAASGGHEAVVRLLLENGAQIEATNENGETPLSLAAFGGHEAVVRLLLENGAQTDVPNENGDIPLSLAVSRGDEAVVRLLLEHGAQTDVPNENGDIPLSLAVSKGHESIVRLLLENGAQIEAENWGSMTPLSLAACSGHESIVRILLENSAQIEARDSDRETALFLAVSKGHKSIVRLLLENGAQIEAKNWSFDTPLFLAAFSGRESIVRILLENGARIEVTNVFGDTPLSLARGQGYMSVVELLEDAAEKAYEKKNLKRKRDLLLLEDGERV